MLNKGARLLCRKKYISVLTTVWIPRARMNTSVRALSPGPPSLLLTLTALARLNANASPAKITIAFAFAWLMLFSCSLSEPYFYTQWRRLTTGRIVHLHSNAISVTPKSPEFHALRKAS